MNKRGSDAGNETAEKQYLVIAYLVFAVLIFLAASNFVKTNATKQAFARDIQSEEFATLADIAASSPRNLRIIYKNTCCEFQIGDGRINSKLPSDVIGKNYALITPSEYIHSKPKITSDVLLKKTGGGLEIDEQQSRV